MPNPRARIRGFVNGVLQHLDRFAAEILHSDGKSVEEHINTAQTELNNAVSTIHARIDGVENLGRFAGAFDTRALVPNNRSGFPPGMTVNDFVTVREDETLNGASTRYVASAIDAGGNITWVHEFTYTQDITGKADRVMSATLGNFAGLNAAGNLTDSGSSSASFDPAGSAAAVQGNLTQAISEKQGQIEHLNAELGKTNANLANEVSAREAAIAGKQTQIEGLNQELENTNANLETTNKALFDPDGYVEQFQIGIADNAENQSNHEANTADAHGRRIATLDEIDEITVFFNVTASEPLGRKFDAFWQKTRAQINSEKENPDGGITES